MNKLLISRNPYLLNLNGLDSIKTINSLSIGSNPALVSLSGLDNIQSLGGNFILGNNDALTNLSHLNLTSVTGDLKIGENIAIDDFSGLSKISYIGGGLTVIDNPLLSDLSSFSNIGFIGERLKIKRNPLLTDLSGLENVISIGGVLEVVENLNLTSLSGIDNIKYGIKNLYIKDNPKLNNCSLKSICNFLSTKSSSADWISSNDEGCWEKTKVFDNCSFGEIVSQIYYDVNQNKIQDDDEPLLTIGSFNINPGNTNLIPNIESGTIAYSLTPGIYNINLNQEDLNNNWQVSTDTSYTINLLEDAFEMVSFGIFPKEFISEMQTNIYSPGTRCNESIPFTLSAKNLGTTFTNGTLWLKSDSSIISTSFVDEPDTIISPYHYGWNYTNLAPSYAISKKIRLNIPGPPEFELGNALFFKSFTTFSDENGETKTYENTYESIVRWYALNTSQKRA